MIQTLRQIKTRIKSIEGTQKITHAMEMISAAKLNRVKKVFYAARPYYLGLESMTKDLVAASESRDHPLLQKRAGKTAALAVISSDTGLCGNYNNNLLRHAESFLKKYDREKVVVIPVGKEAFAYFDKRDYLVESEHLGWYGRYTRANCDRLAKDLIGIYRSARADEIFIAYTHFSTSLKHAPVIEQFLPVDAGTGRRDERILEPDYNTILDTMLPAYCIEKMRIIILDAFTAEHSARMLAMKMATDNAEDLVDTLTLARNKARQAAITKEVLEIAMSAEALKG